MWVLTRGYSDDGGQSEDQDEKQKGQNEYLGKNFGDLRDGKA